MRLPQEPGQVTRKKRSISSYWVNITWYSRFSSTKQNEQPCPCPPEKMTTSGQDAEVVATWSFSSISRRFKSSKASDLSGKSGATSWLLSESSSIFSGAQEFQLPQNSKWIKARVFLWGISFAAEENTPGGVLASLLVDFVNDLILNMIKLKLLVAHSARSCVKLASYR